MITILKDGKPVRHIECPEEMYSIQCRDGETYVEGRLEIPEDTSYKDSVTYKLMLINREYSKAIARLTDGIIKDEMDTWLKQETEARSWLVDNNYYTPLIDAMCSARLCDKMYLVGKIIEKADLYTSEVGKLLGEKQKQEKALLDSSVTKE